jgi:hypothetical protein
MTTNTSANTNVTSIYSEVERYTDDGTIMLITIMALIDNTSGFNRRQSFFILGKMLAEIKLVTPKMFDEVFAYVRDEVLFRSLDVHAKEKGKSLVTLSEIDHLMRGLFSRNKDSLPKVADRLAVFFAPTTSV